MKTYTVYGKKELGKDAVERLVFAPLSSAPDCIERGKATAKRHGFKELIFHENPSTANRFSPPAPFSVLL